MRPPSHLSAFVAIAAICLASCSQYVRPGGRPELDDDTGIAVLIFDTDTPLYDLVFTRAQAFDGFTIDSVDAGRSIKLLELPAARYRLSDFDSGTEDFNPEGGAQLCLMIVANQLNYPGHFVFRNGEEKDGFRTYTNWVWRQDPEDMKRRVKADWTDLMATYPLKSSACP